MTNIDPRILYMILVLPGLFGLTLLGEGLSKIIHEEKGSEPLFLIGLTFILAVVVILIFSFRLV